MFKAIVASVTVLSALLLVLMLNITSPSTAGPFGILLVFLFLYLLLIGLLTYIFNISSRIIAYLSVIFRSRRPLEPLSFKRSYYYSTVFAAAPIMLLGLQSVGKIGFYEYLLVMIFISIGVLYISKRIS